MCGERAIPAAAPRDGGTPEAGPAAEKRAPRPDPYAHVGLPFQQFVEQGHLGRLIDIFRGKLLLGNSRRRNRKELLQRDIL